MNYTFISVIFKNVLEKHCVMNKFILNKWTIYISLFVHFVCNEKRSKRTEIFSYYKLQNSVINNLKICTYIDIINLINLLHYCNDILEIVRRRLLLCFIFLCLLKLMNNEIWITYSFRLLNVRCHLKRFADWIFENRIYFSLFFV